MVMTALKGGDLDPNQGRCNIFNELFTIQYIPIVEKRKPSIISATDALKNES